MYHQFDEGAIFDYTINDSNGNPVNIGASGFTLSAAFVKPNATRIEVQPSLVNSGSDGLMKYTTGSGVLDAPGTWRTQGFATNGAVLFYSDVQMFKVLPNI